MILSQHTQLSDENISTKFGRIPRRHRKLSSRDRWPTSMTDFSTGFSLITREPYTLQTYKLSQKIPLAIPRRLNYIVTRNNAYLKSEVGEIGHFRVISGFFTLLSL